MKNDPQGAYQWHQDAPHVTQRKTEEANDDRDLLVVAAAAVADGADWHPRQLQHLISSLSPQVHCHEHATKMKVGVYVVKNR